MCTDAIRAAESLDQRLKLGFSWFCLRRRVPRYQLRAVILGSERREYTPRVHTHTHQKLDAL